MSTDRSAALALVAGSLAGLLVMAFHPTGGEVSREAAAGGSMVLVQAVHWLAIVVQPLLLAGTLGLTLRLRARRATAVGAFVFFALAIVSVMIAAAASGLVSPGVLRGMHDAGEAGATMSMQNFLHYTYLLNQAFARVYVVLGAIAIALWSWAILGGHALPRGLALYGLLLGAALLVGLASGHLTLGIHGFGLVMLGQGAWLIWAAVALWRGGERTAE
jgi:hypothetical protein